MDYKAIVHWVKHRGFWLIGPLAVIWLLIRSGLNPKRLTYPCQRAAMPIAANWLLAVSALFAGSLIFRRIFKVSAVVITIAGVVWLVGSLPDIGRSSTRDTIELPTWEVYNPVSTVYVMDSIPPTAGSLAAGDASVPDEYLVDPALDTLLLMLEKNNIYLHKTAEHPEGIVGASNIVIIKGNYQWDGRCGTNNDRVKGLIRQILNHPDGFTGEIIVCDNTMDFGTGINQNDNNSEDRNQDIIDVVNTFYDKGYPVYYLDWKYYFNSVVDEYSEGDMLNGFPYDPQTKITYPKFRSPSFNYYISLKYGIWDTVSETYDPDRLCIINFPVLKAHSWAGSTIAVKNWIGVMTVAHNEVRFGGFNPMHDDYFFGPYALVARTMAETFPDLSIVDATWSSRQGPIDTNFAENTNIILASTDPVAVSYYAAKYILTPIADYPFQSDPDQIGGKYYNNLHFWTQYLRDSAGFPVTKSESEMSVYDRGIFQPAFTRVAGDPVVSDGGFSFGAAWADYDNDGYPDLFVANALSPGQPNFLYHNNGDGTFTRVYQGDVTSDGGSLTGTWGDFDNNGYPDIYLANPGTGSTPAANYFYSNNNGTFTRVTSGDHVEQVDISVNTAAVDYNSDGFLDIIVGNHCPDPPCSWPGLRLYHNDGLTFTAVDNIAVGLTDDEGRPYWADIDSDGDQDLFLARPQLNTNGLFVNNGDGTFTESTGQPLTADSAVGGCWGDYDNDGDPDIFVTRSWNEPNKLFANDGLGNFTEVTVEAFQQDSGYWSSGSWADFDNDGDLDLMVTSNYMYQPRYNALYENFGNNNFKRITEGVIADDSTASAGMAWADYDRDGDLDLYVANVDDESNSLYENNGSDNNWINIKCIGSGSNKAAIGARIKIKADISGIPTWQTREISGQTGHFSQNSLNVHFGLAGAGQVDSLRIVWPGGLAEDYVDLEVNQFMTLIEALCGDIDLNHAVNILDITYLINYLYLEGPPPGNPEVADVNDNGAINILDITFIIAYLYQGGPAPFCW